MNTADTAEGRHLRRDQKRKFVGRKVMLPYGRFERNRRTEAMMLGAAKEIRK
jgi:hypothetical protein